MKNTDKDSNIKQVNDAVENDKLVNKPAEQQAVLESSVEFSQETPDVTAGQQLDLALPESQILAMADDVGKKDTKRKDKKNQLDQDNTDQVAESADSQVTDSEQPDSSGEEAVEADGSSEVQGEVAEALAEHQAAKGFGVYLSQLPTPTLVLGSLGVLGALYYNLKDDGEQPPKITSGGTAEAIDENSGAGQVVYTTAVEVSAEETGGVTYSLAEGSDAAVSIDASTGEVTLADNPDAETKAQYSFAVIATDAAGNVSEAQSVTLDINDLDDAAPTITSEAVAPSIVESSGANQVVYTVTADDSGDDVSNTPIIYSLVEGSDNALSINASTGEVSLNVDPKYYNQSSYSFSVIATDASGNISEPQSVTLSIVEALPAVPGVALSVDSGIADDGITNNGEFTVTGIKLGAKWEYSTDNGVNWILGSNSSDVESASFAIATDGDYQVLVRQSNSAGIVEMDSALTVTVETVVPELNAINSSVDDGTITVTFNEQLGVSTPSDSDFQITQGGESVAISNIAINGSSVVLSVADLTDAALQVSYTPSVNPIQDVAGNTVPAFTQMVVSDGYIRDAEVYADINNDGIADESELIEGVTSDSLGQLVISGDYADAQIIIKGGVNVDTGAINQIELTAPAGYSVINPLSTLVNEIINSDNDKTVDQAEQILSQALGISLGEGQDLSSYDPFSDNSENAIDNQVANAKIATVLAVAAAADASDDSGESQIEKNVLDSIVESAVSEVPFTIDTEYVSTLLTGLDNDILDDVEAAINSFDAIADDPEATLEDISLIQAKAVDEISPTSPGAELAKESNLGRLDTDLLTSDSSPKLIISFDNISTDGGAVIVGDTIEFFNNGIAIPESSYVLQSSDVDAGFYVKQFNNLPNGSEITAKIIDIAGNISDISASISIDTVSLEFTSPDQIDNIVENSGANQTIYTASVSGSDFWKFELSDESDSALEIDSITGEVKLVNDPDFELQDSYEFTINAYDNAGNKSSLSLSMGIDNVDDTAPIITSPRIAENINENTASGYVVYQATASDDFDISEGFTFSLADEGLGFDIDANTGVVTTNADFVANFEDSQSQSFTVVATDVAGNVGVKTVTVGVTNLDEVAPTITSADTVDSVDENSGAGQVIYTATADDSVDISGGVTFSIEDTTEYAGAGFAPAESTVSIPDLVAATQHVYVSSSTKSEDGTQETIVISYNADDATTTGLGLRIHFDSSVLSASDISALVSTDLLVNGVVESDDGDLDSDANTDQYIAFGWASLFGAWPGSAPAELVSITFDIAEGATGSSAINLTASSNAAGFTFDGQSHQIAITGEEATVESQLSIDSSTGAVSLSTDPDFETQEQYSFSVTATDAAGNASQAQSVTLDINNLDEVAPTITSGATATAIDENSGAGQVIYTATAGDSDDISDGFTFSLSGDSDAALSMDSATGAVTLSDDPNFEGQSQYTFSVIATDAAGNASDAQSVTLNINNLDEVAPTITSGDTADAIDENSGVGQVVYTATADDSVDISGGVTFSLSEDSDAALSIDATTGEVTLSSDPDHETQSQYSFAFIATDSAGNVSAAKSVTLDINNLDEVAPTITSGDSAAVLESAGAGDLVYRALVDDTSDISAGVTFDLSEDSDTALRINAVTGEVRFADGPDFAVKPSYSFTVIADDGVNQSQKAVTLSVVDEDLEAPIFTSSASVAIDENIGENQVIYTAITDDESLVNYSLSEDSDVALSIDSATGAVTLATDPDHETQSEYSFTVIATDIANNVSEQAVTVSINDLDDAAPTITSVDTAASIDENSGSGQVIYTVTADDSGDDVTATPITYSLTEDSDAGLSINASTGAVSLTADPDHESQSEYSFAVIATDAAGNSSEAQSVTLNINDLDDTAPEIISGETAAAVDENSGANQVIYTATADDSVDVTDGVTFRLSEDSDVALSIDSATGAVTLATNPDHETQSQYSFSVIATDAAGNESAPQAVTLEINDLDDADPVITSSDTATALDENSGAAQVIYTATADDSADISGGVTFSLSEDSDAALSIDSATGAVTLSDDPDAETQSQYTFTVVATDAAGNSSEQAVALNINNLDEVAPTITSGDTAAAVDENSGSDQVVYTAAADDSADVSGGVTFSLSEDSDAALSIDSLTGAVTLATDPDAETQSQYTFTVVATDAAGNSSDQAVTLNINNLDEVAPTITSGDTADAIFENSGAGQVIYTATADDSADISGGVTFSLSEDSDAALSIDSVTGEVTLATDPVFYYQNEYEFSVLSVDAAGNISSLQPVSLQINEIIPPEASVSLETDTGDSADNISSVVKILVSNIKLGATWEYSLDGGITWAAGDNGAPRADDNKVLSFDIDVDGSYEVNVRQTNTAGTKAMSESVPFTLDTLPPIVEFVSADSETGTISVNYNESLDPAFSPNASDYDITQNGNSLTINNLSVIDNVLVLSITESFNPGALNFTYSASTDANEQVTDLAGNKLDQGFTQMIVSDGYIRGAQVYVDVNGDGIADENELREEVTSDAFGQIILSDEFLNAPENIDENGNPYSVIVKGGVNMDSGAPNEIELTAPAGYSVINPLSTLVSEIASSDEFSGLTPEEAAIAAETSLAVSLGIEVGEGGLGSYDPQSDDNVANRVVATQIATVLAVASSTESTGSEGAETAALSSLASTIASAEGTVTLDSSTISSVLSEVIEDADALDKISTAVDEMEAVKASDDVESAFAAIVQAQAKAIDSIAPQAPESSLSPQSDTGVIGDEMTKQDSPTVRVSFETQLLDGTAAVAGDKLEIYSNGVVNGSYVLTEEDISLGYKDHEISVLADGEHYISAKLTDIAGNQSYVTTNILEVDTVKPEITSADSAANIDENSGADQVIYTATADNLSYANGQVTFSLSEDSDVALSIDSTTGAVTLSDDPDFEVQSQYTFSVIATDAAGNASDAQLVTLDINNLDDTAPEITSGATATAIDENSGAGQVIYTATADDSADISGGVTFSLEDEGLGFSIDSNSGVVTTNADFAADYEDAQSQSFTVVATDAAGNASEAQLVTLDINNLDEVAPIITSGDTAIAIDENSGAGQVIYTATADDSADISGGVIFSLSEDSDAALSIDASTGEVTLATDPDFEGQSQYTFSVIATDAAGNASEAQLVTLDINNLDDTAPEITSGETATAIDENSGAGQVIYTATADDSADISGGVTFSLSEDSDAALLIDSTTGAVTLSDDPDFEGQSQYIFSVIATDAAGNASEAQLVTLDINNLDDTAPEITSGETAPAVNENSGAGQVVYTATVDDSADVSDGFTFSLADEDLGFSIDAISGEVTTNADFAADFEDSQSQSFTVVATDAAGNVGEAQLVTLDINNLDEVAPIITSEDTAIAIGENSGAGQVIYTATADDSADISGGVIFSLSQDSDAALSIDVSTGEVTLATDPDFEGQSQYTFSVIATDAAGNVSEPKTVTLDINPIDDTSPVITSDLDVSLFDSSNSVIYQVTASDIDSPDETIAYSFSPQSVYQDPTLPAGAFDQVYSVNSDGSYTMQIIINEANLANYSAGLGNFEFNLNYSELEVSINGFGIPNGFTALANPIDSGVIALSAIYADPLSVFDISAVNGLVAEINFDLKEDVYSAQFEITNAELNEDLVAYDSVSRYLGNDGLSFNEATGEVSLPNAPDALAQPVYSFTITATDAAGNSTSELVTVLIDGAPVITSTDQPDGIDENSGSDQVVYTAISNKPDVTTFTLSEDSDDGLSIDASTGEVTLANNPDYEAQQEYSFTVIATDNEDRSSSKVVTVAVNNLDEVAATFSEPTVTETIDENIGGGQVVFTASADDSGDVSNGVTYNLSDVRLDGEVTSDLSINAATGEVTLASNPDHESGEQYTFIVGASDGIHTPVALQTVTLDVNDLDDAAPTITSGSTAVAIDENSGAGQVIYTTAADDSADISGGLTFSLSENSDTALSIDSVTGEVTLSTDPDYETQSQYSFAVIATDAAGNASEAQSVTLDINDLDEVAPTITSGDTASVIDENSGASQIVYTATADDSADISDGVTLSFVDTTVYSGSDTDSESDTSSNAGSVESAISIPEPAAATQHVYVSSSTKSEDGTQETVVISYNADDATTTGLGLRVHFDSSVLSASEITALIGTDLLVNGVVESDDGDLDSDASTDQTISFGWASLFGQWPGSAPADLASITFDIAEGATDSSAINFTASSNAAGFAFDGQNHELAIGGDIDSDIAAPVESQLSFDSATGVVTLNVDPNYEAQSEYSFEVIATDAAGNASDAQSVTLDINNLDEVAPAITSEAETAVVDSGETNPLIYTATADDSADISGGVTFDIEDTTEYAGAGFAPAESTVSIPDLVATTQHVYVSSSTKSGDGTQETVVVSYNADDTTTTGLGLRIHFDSTQLSVASLEGVFATDNIFSSADARSDDDDGDNDSTTDKYIEITWASLFGSWPGAVPVDLATITFDIAEGATGSSTINIEKSSNAAGFAFDGQSHQIAITGEEITVESQLSIDSATGEVTLSGELDPATQSEYSFTVTATDTAGNSSDLDVVVEAEQPMVDPMVALVVNGDTPSTPIYQASANIEGVSYQIDDLTQYPNTDESSGSAESQISIPDLAASTQHVYVSSSTKSEDGTQETIVISYNADDTTTTGLGLRIHFDSSVLSASDISALVSTDLLVNGVVESDDGDLDSDANTDQYIAFGWASLFGAWPGSAPAELVSITFDIAEGATGSSAINFSASSSAAGFTFAGQSHDLVLAAAEVIPAAELVIDNATGTVSLDGEANSDVMPAYSFTVDGTDADGDAIGSQTVPVVVVDQVVSADAASYTGTADADVFALADGSAEITSDAGADVFAFIPTMDSAIHTITDFESGEDSIDISAALVAAGYTADNAPTQLASADMSADILDLVNGNDSSLDNLFGATYDEDSNTLTVFADTNSTADVTDMDSFQVTLDENATVEDDDIVANLSAFIA